MSNIFNRKTGVIKIDLLHQYRYISNPVFFEEGGFLSGIFFVVALGIFNFPESEEAPLSGYEANVRTVVYEDGSVSRTIELSLNPDNKESVRYKKDFLTKNGYRVFEKKQDDYFIVIASKVFTASKNNGTHFDDEFSRISLQRQNDEVLFKEEFSTSFIMNEVNTSDLRNDRPAAKVLLADMQYHFHTTMPGTIVGVSSGEFNKNMAHWNFDVEALFNHASLEMATTSSVARDDNVIWLVAFTGILFVAIGVLFLFKNRPR